MDIQVSCFTYSFPNPNTKPTQNFILTLTLPCIHMTHIIAFPVLEDVYLCFHTYFHTFILNIMFSDIYIYSPTLTLTELKIEY